MINFDMLLPVIVIVVVTIGWIGTYIIIKYDSKNKSDRALSNAPDLYRNGELRIDRSGSSVFDESEYGVVKEQVIFEEKGHVKFLQTDMATNNVYELDLYRKRPSEA